MKESLGILVELIGDVFVVAGYTGQRLATLPVKDDSEFGTDPNTTADAHGTKCAPLKRYMCSNPKWVAAFLIFALGQALELVALGLASESTVVAVGNLSLVFNAFASVYVFGEDFAMRPRYSGFYLFHQWDAFNLLLLITGSASTVACAPIPSKEKEESYDAAELRRLWMDVPFVYFNFAMVIAMLILGLLCYKNLNQKDEPKAPMFLASTLAILSAFSVTLSKVVSVLIGISLSGGRNQFLDASGMFMTLIWVVGLVMQIVLLNIGLRNFEQGVFVPMFETMSTSITIVFGVAYFQSYNDFHASEKLVGFCLGVLVLIVGLFLTSRRHSPSREEMVARLNERSPRASVHKTRLLEHDYQSFEEATTEGQLNL